MLFRLYMNLMPGTRMVVATAMLAVILSYGLANAFALGPIRVTGDFNKQFKAEIPALTDGEEGLKAWIGDELDYRKVGIERPSFLGNLSIQIKDHPTLPGQKIIYVISREPIYQPSFNLLVKASLGKGAILKNYFLAVDFQKNLNLALPSDTDEEKEEIARIAKELKAKRPPKQKQLGTKRPTAREKELAMIDQIRKEEREAVRQDAYLQKIMRKVKNDEPIKTAKVPKPKPAAKIEAVPKVAPSPKIAKKEAPRAVKAPIVKKRKELVNVGEGVLLPISSIATKNRYEAIKGDSLYKIARRLGASRRNYDRVVVAIWKENSKSFIKGNIHGLKAGADLDYNKVNIIAQSITSAEAKEIINRQWPAWVEQRERYISKTSQAAGKRSPEKIVIKSDALALLSGTNQKIEAKKPVAEAAGAKATAPAKAIADAKKEKKSHGSPYVTHVGSYKKRQAAQRFAKLLRSKGYKAFVSLSFIGGKGYWHRVIVERFKSEAAARRMAKKVRKSGISIYSRVLKLPYAVKVGDAFARDEGSKKIEELAVKGVFAYLLSAEEKNDEGIAQINTYVGAFRTRKAALEAVKRLNASGLKCEVVKP